MTRLAVAAILLSTVPVWAQFTSGSTGADGDLDYAKIGCPGGSVVFDPNSFNPPLNPAHDNVFNFKTINVPGGCGVILSQSILNGPVVWLATGNVTIGGIVDLRGANGGASNPTNVRSLAAPGPGGAGGNGANPPEAGLGPGGGAAGTTNGSTSGGAGKFTGNSFGIPLIGGSGGGGGSCGGGGAGGGAILIASSTQITLGQIYAFGGVGSCNGGYGSGGTVRLVAPTIIGGGGGIAIAGDGNTQCGPNNSAAGLARIESFNASTASGSCSGSTTYGSPYNTFATSSIPPTIKVTSVNGVAVASPATGSFQLPDVTINSGTPVTVQIAASQVPVGTVVNLLFFSDNSPDMTAASTPLAGSLAASTATATVTFPPGYTRAFVSASF
jgi:hypothetical protein